MTVKCVPAVRTKYTQQELIRGFVNGWYKQFKEIPKKESIGVLIAQNNLETGLSASMWNNNIGNVKYILSYSDQNIEYTMLNNVWEIVGGVKQTFQPPSPQTWFRSFPTLADGISFHLDFLKNHRYKSSWSAVLSGDPALFCHLLKVMGYYTAPESDYIRSVSYFFKKFLEDKEFESAVEELKQQILDANLSVEVTLDEQKKEQPAIILDSPKIPEVVTSENNHVDEKSNIFSTIFQFLAKLFKF